VFVIKVLVVDDSALVRKLFGKVFSAEPDFEVQFARNGLEALERLIVFAPDVITLDIEMPQMGGLECLDRIMIERPCPVVIVSSLSVEGVDAAVEALRLGAVDFVVKPGGAVSLKMEAFAPELVQKVRVAAKVKMKASLRLRERVRHRMGAATSPRPIVAAAEVARATGGGLVLVGSSTGGPPALEALLSPLSADFSWPIIVAQHMPATFTGSLAKRLDGLCAIGVREINRPMRIERGCAYIGRGDADVIFSRRADGLVATPVAAEEGYPWHPSADRMVRSAMEHFPPQQLIGVLMTGMGDDGAKAMMQLHALGGKTIAEAAETAVVWGMPGELVRLGGADWVLAQQKIAVRLQQLVPVHAAGP
jgi:two-component system, chemotaxis family, protein-glutamate methylesterase/glutaminase